MTDDLTRNSLVDAINRLAAAIEKATEAHVYPLVTVCGAPSDE